MGSFFAKPTLPAPIKRPTVTSEWTVEGIAATDKGTGITNVVTGFRVKDNWDSINIEGITFPENLNPDEQLIRDMISQPAVLNTKNIGFRTPTWFAAEKGIQYTPGYRNLELHRDSEGNIQAFYLISASGKDGTILYNVVLRPVSTGAQVSIALISPTTLLVLALLLLLSGVFALFFK